MNKTVELVNRWAAFEEKHPEGSIEDFCRYVLIQQREKDSEKDKDKPLVGGVVPMHSSGLLLKIIGRINKLNMTYAYAAFEGTGLVQMEEFGMLFHIALEKNPKKTEVIYTNLMELSSGTDMLNRLKNRGFIKEIADDEDKRSKRLLLTAKGQKVIQQGMLRVRKLSSMLMHDVPEDEKKLCIQLLKGVEQKFSALLPQHKGKPFDEIYEEVVGTGKNK